MDRPQWEDAIYLKRVGAFMRAKVLSVIVSLTISFVAVPALAKDHIQTISTQGAEGFCAHHGGGTTCNFCDARHCHYVSCNERRGCQNLVVDKFKTKPRGIRAPIAGTRKSEDGGKKIRHPVVGVSHPPTKIGAPIAKGKSGGMNQEGGHHRR
jgi:hypothetical protein